jgi:tripartite-type tricarboxylate transporter receptor subunit TctC
MFRQRHYARFLINWRGSHANSKMKARIADLGGTVVSTSPADFAKFIADETEKWGKVLKFTGIKPG